MSEIDQIFSSKNKRKREPESSTEDTTTTALKVVVDRSTSFPLKRSRTEKLAEITRPTSSKKRAFKDEGGKFSDSRGLGPRKKTVEGWNIYNEEELGILGDGGDTPLCPFDCSCCF